MKKFMKKLIKKAEGFTLVELIVVIAILGILAAVAVPAYSGYLTKAKDAAVIVELDAIATAAQAAHATGGAVSEIKVTSATSATVTVATEFSSTFKNDFETFYAGSTVGTPSGKSVTITIPTIDNWTGNGYIKDDSVATWNGTTWS